MATATLYSIRATTSAAVTEQPTSTRTKPRNPPILPALRSYAASGRLAAAVAALDSAAKPKHTFLWNVTIRGLTDAGFFEEAIDLYHRMLASGAPPDHFTFPFVVKSCAAASAADEGLKVHARLIKLGLDSDVFVCNALISFYSNAGMLYLAEKVFDEILRRDIVSWNSLIDGYVTNGEGWNSISCFVRMQEEFRPDWLGILSVLDGCSSENAHKQGKAVHCFAVRNWLDWDVKVQTSILDMYCQCGNMIYAERYFYKMPKRNVVVWNVIIGGYASNKQADESFSCILQMRAEFVYPDLVTLVNLLPACAHMRRLSRGKAVHGYALRQPFLPHLVLETALIDMYGKSGELRAAEAVFNRMKEASLVSWNAMIGGCVQNEQNLRAIGFFVKLLEGYHQPDVFTLSSIVPAFAELSSITSGKQVHSYAIKTGHGSNTLIMNSIVFMYAKCGDLRASKKAFDGIPERDIVSWNSIIMAHGIHGQGRTALELFSSMIEYGFRPNETTFSSVLTACSTFGLIDEGWENFHSMQDYAIMPQIEHYSCMVDLLGRSGNIEAAIGFIENMPFAPTARIWGSLLNSCRNRGDIEAAEFTAERIFCLKHDNTGCYMVLSKMYAHAGRWEDAERMKRLMAEQGLQRTEPKSFVEVNGRAHTFLNDDELLAEEGPTIPQVLEILTRTEAARNPGDTAMGANRVGSPDRHSARAAVAFGLISLPAGTPVLVKKNVRLCDDCHQAIKLVSGFSGREIIVGDSNIFHHFCHGVCCCRDYW